MYINVSFASIQLLYNIRIMRSFTQLRKRYTESRRLGTSIWKSIIFSFSKWEYPITFPIRQEITVLGADSHHTIGWVINEIIGACVYNPYAIARLDICDPKPDLTLIRFIKK